MTKESERFVAYGFVKDGVNAAAPSVNVRGRSITIKGETPEEKLKFIKEKREELAEKGLLNGHLSSEKEVHVHSKNHPKI